MSAMPCFACSWLEGQLSAEGPFSVGATFTLADAAMAPFLMRLSLLEALSGYAMPAGGWGAVGATERHALVWLWPAACVQWFVTIYVAGLPSEECCVFV
jgi:glutathione S-transferase